MKIVMHCSYTGPAKNSMGSERVVESVTKGLVLLGHDVVMAVNPDSDQSKMPAKIVSEVPTNWDVLHGQGGNFDKYNMPWVSTVHGGGNDPPGHPWQGDYRYICISDYIRKMFNNKFFVHNCIDPNDFIYKEKKDNYFLWLAGTDWGEAKGLFSTIAIAKKLKINLKIAGTGKNKAMIEEIKRYCDSKIEYVGAVNGKEKAEILANAKAIINIGNVIEGFCLTNVEAMVSGTPVVAINIGAHPEIVGDCGIICNNEKEIIKAIMKVDKIDPKKCRERVINNFSNIVIAKKYLQVYQYVIDCYRG